MRGNVRIHRSSYYQSNASFVATSTSHLYSQQQYRGYICCEHQANSTSIRMHRHPIQINETCQDRIGDGAMLEAKSSTQLILWQCKLRRKTHFPCDP